jgi:hypothetical protein
MLSVFKQIQPPGRRAADKRDSVKKDCGEEGLPGRKTAEKRDFREERLRSKRTSGKRDCRLSLFQKFFLFKSLEKLYPERLVKVRIKRIYRHLCACKQYYRQLCAH